LFPQSTSLLLQPPFQVLLSLQRLFQPLLQLQDMLFALPLFNILGRFLP
jgi:hypothetical protein